MSKRRLAGAMGALLTLTLLGCGEASSAEEALEVGQVSHALVQVTGFGTNPGNLKMWKYAPANVPANAPLVVALHGCTQTADAYTNTGWNALADQLKFHVLYPEQLSANNQNACFNWFEPGDIARGQGEALSIKQMVDKMKADYSIDGGRVFVTGLSAGAAMTHVMAAAYPDVFSGAAIMAGIPYKCATTMTDAFSCMSPGASKTDAAWGDLVRGAYSGYTRRLPEDLHLARHLRLHREEHQPGRGPQAVDERAPHRRHGGRDRDSQRLPPQGLQERRGSRPGGDV